MFVAGTAALSRFGADATPGDASSAGSIWLPHSAHALFVAVIAVVFLVYALGTEPRLADRRTRFLFVCLTILGTLAVACALNRRFSHLPELVVAPCLLATYVLAIVFPGRFAVGASCLFSLLTAATLGSSAELLLVLFVGSAAAAYQLDEIRFRTKLITSGGLTAGLMALVYLAGEIRAGAAIGPTLQHAFWVAAAALLAAFAVSGLLPFLERVFQVATSLTLLEWRDPTKPLLQALAREAPGTYNHSLVLSTLAQAACESIGANGLLAQVGALYHDVGKIPKADYFVENQLGGVNRHEHLAPSMSLLIILGHVKDGMEMAREFKLPRVLHQFIEEHHGTTVVRYFHQRASELQPRIASGRHDREVREAEFRYGGPKPRTRESAVVMLCDGVEGATRAIPDPTVGRIEGIVHEVISDRLNDGQLDDCPITLKEIHRVEESLVKSLCAIHHGRVAYPKSSRPGDEAAEPARKTI
ncbi:MAG: HDIG domain-containing protein [Planctomycetes bacterium]|nr:HDIG domain-containing protein [Planctomycetota bacterium]